VQNVCDKRAGLQNVPMRLEPGQPAPAFTLPDDRGAKVSLAQLRRAGSVLLYFYPAAGTPGCTKQACDFRDSLGAFTGSGLQVVGVSPDSPEKLAAFRDEEALPFTLLSDPDHAVMQAYGAWGQKQLYGKTVTGVIRSTIVVNRAGKVEAALYNVKATGHVAKLIRDLKLPQ
jgi:thioredoxin-dependent peroxiredoxin